MKIRAEGQTQGAKKSRKPPNFKKQTKNQKKTKHKKTPKPTDQTTLAIFYIPPAANIIPSHIHEMKSTKMIPLFPQGDSHNPVCGNFHSSSHHYQQMERFLEFCFSSR